jgi:hypothetical protein
LFGYLSELVVDCNKVTELGAERIRWWFSLAKRRCKRFDQCLVSKVYQLHVILVVAKNVLKAHVAMRYVVLVKDFNTIEERVD